MSKIWWISVLLSVVVKRHKQQWLHFSLIVSYFWKLHKYTQWCNEWLVDWWLIDWLVDRSIETSHVYKSAPLKRTELSMCPLRKHISVWHKSASVFTSSRHQKIFLRSSLESLQGSKTVVEESSKPSEFDVLVTMMKKRTDKWAASLKHKAIKPYSKPDEYILHSYMLSP